MHCRQTHFANSSLHVFAACSAEDAAGWRRARYERFESTMRVWGLPFACVGRGERWRGFGEMAMRYAAAAESVPTQDHVVMLDSADAFAQGAQIVVCGRVAEIGSCAMCAWLGPWFVCGVRRWWLRGAGG